MSYCSIPERHSLSPGLAVLLHCSSKQTGKSGGNAAASHTEDDAHACRSKSQFGGSNKRARTAAASQWDSQVFSDDEAEADVRTKLGAATLAGDAARKPRTAGILILIPVITIYVTMTVTIVIVMIIVTTKVTVTSIILITLSLFTQIVIITTN